MVGAGKEDLKRLGLDSPEETISLAKKAAEKEAKSENDESIKEVDEVSEEPEKQTETLESKK